MKDRAFFYKACGRFDDQEKAEKAFETFLYRQLKEYKELNLDQYDKYVHSEGDK